MTHRRSTNKLLDGYAILFAEDNNKHYGDHVWELLTSLPNIDDALVGFVVDWFGVDTDEAREMVNPDKIVSDAGAWDNTQFVSDLWQAMDSGQIKMVPGYRTLDGAVVLDKESVELRYYLDNN